MIALLLVVAIAADSLTYALMPPGHEANPLVAAGGLWAIVARWVAVAILIVATHRLRHRRAMLLAGVAAGVVGTTTNVLAIAR